MDIQQKLLEIDEDLTSEEVAELKFLCMDLVRKKRLETVSDAKDLFQRLEEQALLDDARLLSQLLFIIGRFDLLGTLGTSKEQVRRSLQVSYPGEGISPYRKMLYELSADVTDENLRVVKFLLPQLPKAKLRDSAKFLDVLTEMEKHQILGEDNLDELQNILNKCDKQLAYRIEEFKIGGRRPLQEVSIEEGERMFPFTQHEETEPGQVTTDSEPGTNHEIEHLEYYAMTQRPLGYCLIINNYNFENSTYETKLRNRTGTHRDKDELIRVFEKMHFRIEVADDLQASTMRDVIQEFAGRDHSQMDAFVCCILSHGEQGTVLGVDGKQVAIRDLTRPFSECRSLTSKPKLFFIQACQGKKGQEPVWIADGEENTKQEEMYEEDAYSVALHSLPIEADVLIGMATVEHYQSFRHIREGSIYIQELCKQLEKLCPKKEDILSILTKVNHEVSKKVLIGRKQMPEPRYTLTKKLVFPMD